jgi:hypothetical protein
MHALLLSEFPMDGFAAVGTNIAAAIMHAITACLNAVPGRSTRFSA